MTEHITGEEYGTAAAFRRFTELLNGRIEVVKPAVDSQSYTTVVTCKKYNRSTCHRYEWASRWCHVLVPVHLPRTVRLPHAQTPPCRPGAAVP
jgi:hypothetical protein